VSNRPPFPSLLESFFRHRMIRQRNATAATIASYRDSLRMLVLFAANRARCEPCDLVLDHLDRNTILAFLDHLEATRGNKIQTRNARLAAVRSFFRHAAASDPESLGIAHQILAIPIKKTHTEVTRHLTRKELDALIAAPDQQTARGRRDRALLLFLGRTGARVSEALAVNVDDLRLDRSRPQVLLHGKGRRERVVPIAADLADTLRAMITEHGLEPGTPIFQGAHGVRMTRFGATHVVRRAVAAAAPAQPGLAGKIVSPHVFRHTLAMTLLQSGVDLLTIQAWLGHSQVATTHRYAAADVEMMRRGLDRAAISGKQPARFKAKDRVLQLLESI
jgi:integrase/recombinase XerD